VALGLRRNEEYLKYFDFLVMPKIDPLFNRFLTQNTSKRQAKKIIVGI
jgi:hypothetical protein